MRAEIRRKLEAVRTPPPPAVSTDSLLTPEEVAKLLKVSPDTVKRAFRGRRGTVMLPPLGKSMRIPAAALKAYIEEGMVR